MLSEVVGGYENSRGQYHEYICQNFGDVKQHIIGWDVM